MAEWFQPDPRVPEWQISITSVSDGNMSFRYGPFTTVQAARRNVLSNLEIDPGQVMSMSLDVSHGVHWLETLPKSHPFLEQQGFPSEGIWMPAGHGALFLIIADCFPIAVYDPASSRIGMFHGGRPELQAGLFGRWLKLGIDHGVDLLKSHFFIGPRICHQHYTFQEIPQTMMTIFKNFIKNDKGRFHIDLRKFIHDELKRLGVLDAAMVSDTRCTFESPDLFSHRKSQSQKSPEARFAFITSVNL